MRKEIEELLAECWLEAISSEQGKKKDFKDWCAQNKYKIDLLKFDI